MNAEKLAFLTTFVQHPEEAATAEYKSGIAFDAAEDFGAKIIKHIIGQANAVEVELLVPSRLQVHCQGKLNKQKKVPTQSKV